MPIRINLLAEAQALEEQRRRDPVKRAIWAGVLIGVLILVWSGYLQLRAMVAKADVNKLEAQIQTHTNEYQVVLDHRKKLGDYNSKLSALTQLATTRFLNGTMLDALQHTTLDDVQLMRIKTDHTYVLTEEVKAKTNATGKAAAAKPATVTEKILLTLDAKDTSTPPGERVTRFLGVVAESPYFRQYLGRTNEVKLDNVGTPQPPGPDGKAFLLFSLQCRYPEKTR
jgi:hypothetical protein